MVTEALDRALLDLAEQRIAVGLTAARDGRPIDPSLVEQLGRIVRLLRGDATPADARWLLVERLDRNTGSSSTR